MYHCDVVVEQQPSPEMNGDGDVDRDPWKDSVKAPVNPAPGEYPSPRRRCKGPVLIHLLFFPQLSAILSSLSESNKLCVDRYV